MTCSTIRAWSGILYLVGYGNVVMGRSLSRHEVFYLALFLLGHDAVLDAATITVTTLADNAIVDGHLTLREAIQAANLDASVDGSAAGNGADEIVFATGAGTLTLGGTQLPTVTDTLTITGPGASELGIDANGLSRVLEVPFGITVHLSGLTIAGGTTITDNGGAIINHGSLTLSHCTLSGNATSLEGGGVYNTGTLDVRNSILSGNSALNGGAIANETTGILAITESTLAANFTGGIAPFAGGGGAILNGGSVTITRTTISGNAAGNGGGIVNTDGSTLTITNGTLSTNQALNNGGGISNVNGMLTMIHSTVTGNRSDANNDSVGNGGGIRVSSGTVLLDNAIVAGNFNGTGTTPVDIFGTVHSASSFNLVGVDTGLAGISDGTGGNQIGTAGGPLDPMLALLQDNGGSTYTHEPLGGSLAIDSGQFSTSVSTDQRGVTRPQGSEADVGAVEVFLPTPLPTDRDIQDQAFVTFEVVEACNSISAGPNVQVTSSSGLVAFRAGSLVVLRNGFSVEPGGEFAVLIQVPTACFGSFP